VAVNRGEEVKICVPFQRNGYVYGRAATFSLTCLKAGTGGAALLSQIEHDIGWSPKLST
jgi:hypothetical protein